MIGLALVLALAAVPPSPTYLVERVVTSGGEVRRVSVFRDGMAVLARHRGEEAPQVARRRLGDVPFAVLRQVVGETYPELKAFAGFGGHAGEAVVELRVAPPGEPPLILRIPLSAVQSAALVRLQRALDDVDEELTRTRPGQQDLTHWQPKVGERVELSNGTVVEIMEVFGVNDGSVIHVRVGDGPAHIFYALDELRRLAVRVLGG